MRAVFEMSLAEPGSPSQRLIKKCVFWFSVICVAGKCLKTQRRQSTAASFNLQQGNKSVTLEPWQAPPLRPCSNLEPHTGKAGTASVKTGGKSGALGDLKS